VKITITPALLKTLGVGFKASYQGGLDVAPTDHEMIAMEVPSTTKSNEYGWLGKFPSVREWLGDRVVQNMAGSSYTITNKDFELTIGVDRNDIEDDELGIYGPMFSEMGSSTGSKSCQLVYDLLKAGFATACYDGQFFFDTDHPVLNEAGVVTSVANTDGGAGTPWFLADLSPQRKLKPLILQKRKDFEFVSKDAITDDNVFMRKEFLYGADARMNVGYGFWQMIWGSKQTLNAANLATAFAAIEGMKGDYGRPLGLKPTHLIVPPSLRSAATKLANNELGANGESNEWKGTFTPLITPWLA
jgi:phage major head subunit gpT-like protein